MQYIDTDRDNGDLLLSKGYNWSEIGVQLVQAEATLCVANELLKLNETLSVMTENTEHLGHLQRIN